MLSFALNATFDPDGDLVRRLIAPGRTDRGKGPADVLRRTFDAGVLIKDGGVEDLRAFMAALLGLRRTEYEKAIRAIRQVVRACGRAADDPTLAYTMLVAALESLSGDTTAGPADWQAFDRDKRGLIDGALQGVPVHDAARIRQALLDAEALGSGRRLEAFVADHVSPSYYRQEAAGATRPIRAPDLRRALRRAYGIRSRNVHVLAELPPEAWVFTQHASTCAPPAARAYSASKGSTGSPGTSSGTMSPAARPTSMPRSTTATACPASCGAGRAVLALEPRRDQPERRSRRPRRARGGPRGVLARRDGAALPDMREALARIEEVVPGRDQQAGTAELVVVYLLWHAVMGPEYHRPSAAAFLDRYEWLLDAPTMTAFVLRALEAEREPWPTDDLAALAAQRLHQRRRGKAQQLPAVFDAALHASAAAALAAAGRHDEALENAARAVEEMPGDARLMSMSRHCDGTPRRRSTCARSCSAYRTTPRTATARTAPRTATASTTRRLSTQRARCTTARARTAPEPATRGSASRPAISGGRASSGRLPPLPDGLG
ncbi:MAG: hypothetical protein ACR2JU_04415 [Nocardioidaceae bacterium]